MGGRALKQYGVERIPDSEYVKRIGRFNELMNNLPKECGYVEYYIPGDVHKEDRGDLDVVFYAERPDLVLSYLSTAFASAGKHKNANVTSIEWERFQVDMIHMSKEKLQFAKHYYAHGTCAAIIGRMAKYFGFHLGWDGLQYTVHVGNNKKFIPLTKSWEEALKLLGYNKPLDYKLNYSVEEVYEFLLSSSLIDKKMFRSSRPDRNYGFQEEFFEHIKTANIPDVKYDRRHGIRCLVVNYPFQAITVLVETVNMKIESLIQPYRRKWRKLWFTTLMPLMFKLRGW